MMTLQRLLAEHPGAVQGAKESEIAAALEEALAMIDPPVQAEEFDGDGDYSAVALADPHPVRLVSVTDASGDGEVPCVLVQNSVRAARNFVPPIEVNYVSRAGAAQHEQQIVAHVRARCRREE